MEQLDKSSLKSGFIFLMVVLALITITSCVPTKYIAIEHLVEKTDSLVLTDTIVNVQLVPYKDSVTTDTSHSFLKNPYAYSYASYDGQLHHSLGIFPQPKPVSIQMPKEYITITERKEVPVPVERKLTKWEQTKMNYGGKAILMCIIYTILVIVGATVYFIKK